MSETVNKQNTSGHRTPCNAQVKSGQEAGRDVVAPALAGSPLASAWATPAQPSLRPGALPWVWLSHPDGTAAPSSEETHVSVTLSSAPGGAVGGGAVRGRGHQEAGPSAGGVVGRHVHPEPPGMGLGP